MKNKIHKYDFLIVGAGLIGSIAAFALYKNNFKVLVIDKEKIIPTDERTLAVNANSKDFLCNLGIWADLKSKPQPINKILIKDYINTLPLIFEDSFEAMGNVILNSEMLKIVREKLEDSKILKTNIDINLNSLLPNKTTVINKKNYSFKKIIISIGKNNNLSSSHGSIKFDQGHNSYVGFFKHSENHNNYAYEIFNPNGPLAVLPAPSNNKKKSTFIYSTKNKISFSQIQSLLKKNFKHTHGQLYFEKSIFKFPITPHLRKNNQDFIYIGDSLKSIHPVAGQGWNLGIKDIQKLIELSKTYPLDFDKFNSIYYSNRISESALYLGFTSFLNFLYENKNPINKRVIKVGYSALKYFKFIRILFIRQAMGRSNLV
jgi:2-octaprenyl-6-methoxyphenol hydroxylase